MTNVVPNSDLERIASSDQRELIKTVNEYYVDYYAVDDYVFSLNTKTNLNEKSFRDRCCDGIVACLLSLKKRPTIRYDKNSQICKIIAEEITQRIEVEGESGLFDFKKDTSQPLLLLLDRRDDPVTPLLTQWTYQAMVHELVGINNNMIVTKDKEEVLSAKQDEFFATNMYMNWGDLCGNIKVMVDNFQKVQKTSQNISSLDDIRSFMHKFPEFQKTQSTMEKHISLVYGLKDEIAERRLLQISKVEQELACGTEDMLKDLKALLKNQEIDFADDDLVRCVMLYAIRYEKNAKEISALISMLDDRDIDKSKIALVKSVLKYAGGSCRNPGLFEEGTSTIQNIFTMLGGGIRDVDNVYTQHKPLLRSILNSLGKLSETMYPFFGLTAKGAPKEVIIFMVGGITYEEALTVWQFNNDKKNTIKIVLGGNIIHNSDSFIKQIEDFQKY
jgi:vacuolar protein sorting-associated protein 45